MNMEEYKQRIENDHTFTGIPSYWKDLQDMTAKRDCWRNVAKELYTWLLLSDEDDSVHEAGLDALAMYDEAARNE